MQEILNERKEEKKKECCMLRGDAWRIFASQWKPRRAQPFSVPVPTSQKVYNVICNDPHEQLLYRKVVYKSRT